MREFHTSNLSEVLGTYYSHIIPIILWVQTKIITAWAGLKSPILHTSLFKTKKRKTKQTPSLGNAHITLTYTAPPGTMWRPPV